MRGDALEAALGRGVQEHLAGLEVTQDVLAHAKKVGATACEVDVSEGYGQSVSVRKSEVETIEYNRANVIKVFTDLPDLFADVQASANKVALFRKDLLDAAAKNS